MRYNHTYQPKNKCKFEGCNNYKAMSCGGYCNDHKECDPGFDRKEAKKEAKKTEGKIKMLSVGITDNKLLPNTAATEFQLLQNFFADAARELAKKPICQECGAKISSFYFRASTAHILAKRKEYGFPSVATHPLNRLFLGSECGCHEKSHTWSTFSKMKVWPLAVIAFKEIYPSIAQSELKNLPDILRAEINNAA